jgi:RNA polymerase sigma-70 factor, ECF subfamily
MMVAPRDGMVTFEGFFRDEYPRLVPMLQALLGDRQRAEDVAQDALAAAQRDWDRVSRLDRPGAWVRRVALNASSNTRRNRAREAAALRRLGGSPEASRSPVEGDEELWLLVRRLPEQQRWAVALHYVEDRTVADVAGILRCSEGTVKTHLSRARAALARQLPDPRTEATS